VLASVKALPADGTVMLLSGRLQHRSPKNQWAITTLYINDIDISPVDRYCLKVVQDDKPMIFINNNTNLVTRNMLNRSQEINYRAHRLKYLAVKGIMETSKLEKVFQVITQSTKLSSIYVWVVSTGRRPVISSRSMTPKENTSDFSESFPEAAYSGAKYLKPGRCGISKP
jgi:hypothetical protein